jgi:hypothetical protein
MADVLYDAEASGQKVHLQVTDVALLVLDAKDGRARETYSYHSLLAWSQAMTDGPGAAQGLELETVDGKGLLIACEAAAVVCAHMMERATALARKLRPPSLPNSLQEEIAAAGGVGRVEISAGDGADADPEEPGSPTNDENLDTARAAASVRWAQLQQNLSAARLKLQAAAADGDVPSSGTMVRS